MMDKIKNVIKPSEDMKYKKFINNFRKEHIPEQYNQIKLLDELNNSDIDNKLIITFIKRKMMLHESYKELINNIIEISSIFDRSDFNFIRTQYYVSLNYKDQTIAIISDLNNASELKYFSNYIKKFPIIV